MKQHLGFTFDEYVSLATSVTGNRKENASEHFVELQQQIPRRTFIMLSWFQVPASLLLQNSWLHQCQEWTLLDLKEARLNRHQSPPVPLLLGRGQLPVSSIAEIDISWCASCKITLNLNLASQGRSRPAHQRHWASDAWSWSLCESQQSFWSLWLGSSEMSFEVSPLHPDL